MNGKERFDVLIIGGGPGGTPAALALAQAGKRVLLVEAGRGLGGTCLFEGCIPSKIYREVAARRREYARAAEFGIQPPANGALPVNWSAVRTRRHHILTQRAQAALAKAKALDGLEISFGHARLTGSREAMVEGVEGARAVSFEHAILATGSEPNHLPIAGADLPGVLDSTGLIEIGFVPESLALIGGGPVGVEMAQIFAMLGTRVTLLEAMPRILGPVDSVLAGLLAERLAADGIDICTGVKIDTIEGTEREHTVRFSRAGTSREARAQVVALVAGRHPRVSGLGLETTAVRHDRHGVKVDETLQTDEPGIYATGDLVGSPMFAHWATAQAQAVARLLLGKEAVFPRPEHNSAVIFSYPELGMAGLTEEAARAAGEDVSIAEYDYRVDARAQISADASGRLRIVYRLKDRRILGIHALVEGAGNLMGEAALAVRHGLTLDELAAAIHPHPTLTEAFGFASHAAH
ncbi:MAG TPA: NAD(P)/FAD-dependent oxidoreductase [Gammaproteobacteria bacterium]|nr:NAD(P)/FAD-dependent oxidoreductase [Gammaproteobacteria bacterium]